ncbi:HAMP domain-containing sensor histidine kinase [Hyalangium rubrum]|uniref:histidine kinase n=1 Tax=Hyalangium rubrum TaxID=3103134 RepID=A0ABU5HF18_9BACT|nr:HAMP domain-containing sensor histidine kinase [Hyalangium sp. s54d21]MDY7231855.1 HAMP domain-containing sensor histidine kinase [Hyalangium sp. s54d21]
MSLSLRSHAIAVTLVLGTLTLGTVAALVFTTTRMEHNTARLWHALESVRATEELQKGLMSHEREQRLYEATNKPVHAEEAQAIATRLRQELAQARQLADTGADSALLDELNTELEHYLANPTPRPGSPEANTGRMLARELQISSRLVEQNLADARATLEANQRWDRLANVVGLAVSLALVAGLALTFLLVRSQVYWPLRAVREALLHFRPGAPLRLEPRAGVRELQDIAHTFNETASRLEKQREVQLGFLAGVAHDLRNPLQALRMASSSVNPDRPLPPEDKLRARFALVNRQVDRLTRMVDDLLDTTRIEAGQLSLNVGEHDLIELVQEAVELHRPSTQLHELVTCFPEDGLTVRCDSTRISQVLNNLLSNAIKYSPAGGQVHIEVGEEEDGVWVAVSDPGVGIPTSEQESIFEPFRRSAASRTHIPGVGLGLSVARRILNAHGGTIEVRSTPGRGSTFCFRLPWTVADERTRRPSGYAAPTEQLSPEAAS